ncbi:MAG: flagellar hook-basal body complex protein [Planctomycetes bacterium]|nr:flagellar hook-basal body complex protein [Planctomycetota bacterium]
MANSLQAGVSGLRAHQTMLDVVGNNLANINTPGYKTARTMFSTLISETIRAGNSNTDGTGGVNPTEVGLGVKVSGIDLDLRQGSLQNTGRTLDLAIEGEGYFVLSNGQTDVFSRVGAFDLDSQNKLVSVGTGFRVQSNDGSDITVDVDASLPASATTNVEFTGNLDAEASAPAAAQIGSSQPFQQGTRAVLSTAGSEPFALAAGMQFVLKVDGQAPLTVTFNPVDFVAIGAATAAEVAAAINAQAPGVQATDVGGSVELISIRPGDTSSLDVDDGAGSPVLALGFGTSLVFGSQSPANAATLLNDLPQKSTPYVPGDKIHIAGNDATGAAVSATFVFGAGGGENGTTLGDLTTFIGSLYPGGTTTLLANGAFTIEANQVGASSLQLGLTDDPANVGFTAFSSIPFETQRTGDSGAELTTSIDVVDTQGTPHKLRFTLRKSASNEWDVTLDLPGEDGVIVDGQVQGLKFNEDGSFDFVAGVGVGDQNIEVLFNGLSVAQTVTLDFGPAGGFNGLTQFGSPMTAGATTQDGFESGTLASLSVNGGGSIQGIYTNGRVRELAELQIATFKNPAGLAKVGDSLFAVSSNSGSPLPGTALSGRAGKVLAGVLEESNVDIALEFTRLITAQRGFQVNARTITTTDQMMQELANLIR